VRGGQVELHLDGALWGSLRDDAVTEPFGQVVTRDVAKNQLVVKVVNAQDRPARTTIDLGGARVMGKAEMTVITGDPEEQNADDRRGIGVEDDLLPRLSSTVEWPRTDLRPWPLAVHAGTSRS
jgi:hypothetical protein